MGKRKMKNVYESEKFQKAVRFERPFEGINYEKANYEITSHEIIAKKPELSMEITEEDLLCGLKKVKKLKGTSKKNAYKTYIKKIAEIYKKEELKLYWSENWDLSQYPAPKKGFYVYYIMESIKKNKFDIDESIKLLEIFIDNKNKTFLKKHIPDVGIVEMFDSGDIVYYQCESENIDKKLVQKKIVEYIEKAYILGNKEACKEKATNELYFEYSKKGFDPYEVANITEKLITKYHDFEVLCKYGYANSFINSKRLFKYYKEGLKKGYNVGEEIAKMIEFGRGTKSDPEKALELRKEIYKKYKSYYNTHPKEYLADTNYGYAAYNLGKAILNYAYLKYKKTSKTLDILDIMLEEKSYECLKPNKNWIEYFKEAKKMLKGKKFLIDLPLEYDDFLKKEYIEKSILDTIKKSISHGAKEYYFTNSTYLTNNYQSMY